MQIFRRIVLMFARNYGKHKEKYRLAIVGGSGGGVSKVELFQVIYRKSSCKIVKKCKLLMTSKILSVENFQEGFCEDLIKNIRIIENSSRVGCSGGGRNTHTHAFCDIFLIFPLAHLIFSQKWRFDPKAPANSPLLGV